MSGTDARHASAEQSPGVADDDFGALRRKLDALDVLAPELGDALLYDTALALLREAAGLSADALALAEARVSVHVRSAHAHPSVGAEAHSDMAPARWSAPPASPRRKRPAMVAAASSFSLQQQIVHDMDGYARFVFEPWGLGQATQAELAEHGLTAYGAAPSARAAWARQRDSAAP